MQDLSLKYILLEKGQRSLSTNPNKQKYLGLDLAKETYQEHLFLIKSSSDTLRQGVLSGIAGALLGFQERGLNPKLSIHYTLFKEIVQEIVSISDEIWDKLVSHEVWLHDCFEYGVKKVYHLDWKLYMSKECY
ncbi:MAG: hypothetical protein AAF518_13400 [Spirochaetota bacterium]